MAFNRFKGHSLTGPGADKSKIGISLASSSGITIKGPGTISGFQAGVLDAGDQTNVITGVNFDHNQIAVFTTSVKNVVIESNKIFNNDIGFASYLSSGTNFQITYLIQIQKQKLH